MVIDNLIGEIDIDQISEVPSEFIIGRYLYCKQMDGLYHRFKVGSVISIENSLECIGPYTIKHLYNGCKFKRPVVVCTNDVHECNSTATRIFSYKDFVQKYCSKFKRIVNEISESTK